MQTEYVLQPSNSWIQRVAVCSVAMTFLAAGAPARAGFTGFISGGFAEPSPLFPPPGFSPNLITGGWDLSASVVATSTLLDPFQLRTINVPNTLSTYYYTIGAVGPGFVIAHGDASASGTASGGGTATSTQVYAGGSFSLGFFDNQFPQGTSAVGLLLNNGSPTGTLSNSYTTPPIFVPANATQYFTATQINRVYVTAKALPSDSPAEASGTVHSTWSASFVPGDTLQDLRDNVVIGAVNPTLAGPVIQASFAPNFGMTLEEAAHQVFGVDHFNWLSHITHFPDHWTITTSGGQPVTAPFLDPYPGATLVIHDTLSGHDFTIRAGTDSFSDLQPYYWDEPGPTRAFFDSPRVPLGMYSAPDDHIGFQTSLVGVAADGTPIPTGVAFRWNSNAAYLYDPHFGLNVGSVYLSTVDDGTLPPIVSGGVYDVQVVPEPSALALGLFGALAIALARNQCNRSKRRMKRPL